MPFRAVGGGRRGVGQASCRFAAALRASLVRPPAWVPHRDERRFAAQGLEQGRQGGGCTRAFESDVEATTAAGELAASFDDLVTGR